MKRCRGYRDSPNAGTLAAAIAEHPVFRHLLKIIHLLALAGFAGGLASTLLLSDFTDTAPPSVLAALLMLIASLGETLVVPSLVLMALSGMLLVITRPQLVRARWVWAKAVLTVVIAIVALGVVQPAITRAALLAAEGALGTPALNEMSAAFGAERAGSLIVLALSVVAVVLAVWRPRLGQSPHAQLMHDEYAPTRPLVRDD